MVLRIKVKPNSKNPRVERDAQGNMTVYLKSPPVEGKANEELIRRLAVEFGVPKSRVGIKSGASGRNKLVEILE